jgi:hypothetical protein
MADQVRETSVFDAGDLQDSAMLNKSPLADIRVAWTTVPSFKIKEEVLAAWRDVAFDRGSTIQLYVADNPIDLYDYQLIE